MLCLVPPPVSESVVAPIGEPTTKPVEPFDKNLIAAIVCVPVAVGVALFLGVFFGRRNAKKKKAKDDNDIKDDLPLKPIDTGKVRPSPYPRPCTVLMFC